MAPPADPLVRRNIRDLRGEFLRRTERQMQFEGRIVGSREAQQGRIERPQRLHVDVDGFRHQPQIDGVARFHHVGRDRRLWLCLNVVVRRILGNERQRDDDGHIVFRFAWKHIALIELPEIGITRPFDALLHVAGPAVVSGHRQIPVAVELVEIAKMLRGGVRGLLGVLSFIDPPGMPKAVLLPAVRHELPDSSRAGA